ncbi:hypothetical protein D3C71_1931850 [compost metagenome]
MRKDIAHLADGVNAAAGFHQPIEQGRLRRQHGKIAPVAGPLETFRGLAGKGSRDHAADIERIEQAAHHLAKLNQPLQPEMRLMCGDLEDAVA